MKKIVIVEDEVITAMDIQGRLETMGYDVPAISMTGEEAIHLAERIKPDLMLMDIMLKGEMDGTIAAREINEKFQIPIVFLTAYDDKQTFSRAKKSNPFAYLSKPFGSTELENAIELALYKNEMITEIQNAKKKYHAVVENANIGIILHDFNGVIHEVNQAAENIFGVSKAIMHGRNIREYIPDGELNYLDIKLKKLQSEGTTEINVGHIIQPNGTVRDVEMLATCISIDNVKLLYSLINDITEKNKFISRSIFDEKISTLGKLSAEIIHEINNPLTAILLNLDIAQGAIAIKIKQGANGGTAELSDLVDQATYGAKRIKSIVSELKDFSRKDDVVALKCVNEIVKSAINITAPHYKHHAQIMQHFTQASKGIMMNAGKLEQVLVNIIINASQAFYNISDFDHNIITIDVSVDKLTLNISIKDTGKGIPQDKLKYIFDPFFTTKPPGVGTGLGLSICKQIVQSLGGEMHVESKVDAGTTFNIRLPIKLKAEESISNNEPISDIANNIILVVDDDQPSLEIMRHMLGKDNKIFTTSSGKEALHILQKAPDNFDLIISDLNMPDINGSDLYMHIKLNHPELAKKVILISGGVSESVRRFMLREKIPYLEKPYTLIELKDVIKKIKNQ